MSTPPTPADYTTLLDGLIRAGTKLAHEIADSPATTGDNRARDFHLATQSVRRCILLIGKITARPAQIRTAARKQILRVGQDAIQHRARGPNAENLRAELHERLDDPDLDDEIGTRPIADIIDDIIRDLRLVTIDPGRYQRRTPDDVRALALLAEAPIGQTAARAATLPHPPASPALPPLPNRPDQAVATILRHEARLRDQR